jgi:hypothetical protein
MRSGWRRERFAFLYDIGTDDQCLGVAVLDGMRCCDRQLKAVARLQHARRLPLYRQFEGAGNDVARFDSRVSMPRHTARIDARFGSKTDMPTGVLDVCCYLNSGHGVCTSML